MDTASQQILLVLEHLVKLVPIGTNLALLQLMWAMLTGNFLPSRGAVHTALHLAGFQPSSVRRSCVPYGMVSGRSMSYYHAGKPGLPKKRTGNHETLLASKLSLMTSRPSGGPRCKRGSYVAFIS